MEIRRVVVVFASLIVIAAIAQGCGGEASSGSSGGESSVSSSSSSSSEIVLRSQAVTTYPQSNPIALSNGDILVGWTQMQTDVEGNVSGALRFQKLAANGALSGSPIAVGDLSTYVNSSPAISLLASGSVGFAWHTFYNVPSSSAIGTRNIVAQILPPSLSISASTPFTVTSYIQDYFDPTVTGLSNGNMLVAWDDYNEYPPIAPYEADEGYDVKAQIYSSSGVKVGPLLLLNSISSGNQRFPSVAPLANGGFVAVWQDDSAMGADSEGAAVRGQVFLADGSKSGSEFLINTNTSGDQTVPRVASLAGGGFVVTWQDASQTLGDASVTSVKAQVFAADGSRINGEFLVNTTTSGGQGNPDIAPLSGGGFVIAWEDASQTAGDTGASAIRSQVFSASGARVGNEVLVNAPSSLTKRNPRLGALANGGYVVSWKAYTDASGKSGTESVVARIFAS